MSVMLKTPFTIYSQKAAFANRYPQKWEVFNNYKPNNTHLHNKPNNLDCHS